LAARTKHRGSLKTQGWRTKNRIGLMLFTFVAGHSTKQHFPPVPYRQKNIKFCQKNTAAALACLTEFWFNPRLWGD
jgi:hypothetical protein